MATALAEPPKRRDGLLWTGMLLPPILWLSQLETDLALARHACRTHSMHVYVWTNLGFTIAVIATALMSWSVGRGYIREEVPAQHDRPRFMAMAAVAIGVFFIVLALATSIPWIVMNPCD